MTTRLWAANRKCDCGCRRPVVYLMWQWDLGFSLRCEDKLEAAYDAYFWWLVRTQEEAA